MVHSCYSLPPPSGVHSYEGSYLWACSTNRNPKARSSIIFAMLLGSVDSLMPRALYRTGDIVHCTSRSQVSTGRRSVFLNSLFQWRPTKFTSLLLTGSPWSHLVPSDDVVHPVVADSNPLSVINAVFDAVNQAAQTSRPPKTHAHSQSWLLGSRRNLNVTPISGRSIPEIPTDLAALELRVTNGPIHAGIVVRPLLVRGCPTRMCASASRGKVDRKETTTGTRQ